MLTNRQMNRAENIMFVHLMVGEVIGEIIVYLHVLNLAPFLHTNLVQGLEDL